MLQQVNGIVMGFVCKPRSGYCSGCPSTDLRHSVCDCTCVVLTEPFWGKHLVLWKGILQTFVPGRGEVGEGVVDVAV